MDGGQQCQTMPLVPMQPQLTWATNVSAFSDLFYGVYAGIFWWIQWMAIIPFVENDRREPGRANVPTVGTECQQFLWYFGHLCPVGNLSCWRLIIIINLKQMPGAGHTAGGGAGGEIGQRQHAPSDVEQGQQFVSCEIFLIFRHNPSPNNG